MRRVVLDGFLGKFDSPEAGGGRFGWHRDLLVVPGDVGWTCRALGWRCLVLPTGLCGIERG
jgi:hypothetical protein